MGVYTHLCIHIRVLVQYIQAIQSCLCIVVHTHTVCATIKPFTNHRIV